MKSIIFLSDSNLDNPILHKQGLPLLIHLSKMGYKVFFVFFIRNNEKISAFSKHTISSYSQSIHFIEIKLNSIKIIPTWALYFFLGFMSLRKIISENRIKILHARSLLPATLSYLLKIFNYKKIKVIYDNRGVYIDEMIEIDKWKKNGIKEKIFRQIEYQVERYCDKIVVVSNYFKTYLLKKHKKDITFKIDVISNRTLIDMNIDLTQKYSNKTVLVYSGSCAIWQNSFELKKLFTQALNIFDDVIFKIISYEPDKFQNLFSADSALLDKINIDSVEPQKVKDELRKCNCGILLRENNLINNVSSPLKFAEYLAAGLPVLLSEGIGDTESIINEYNVGVVIKNNNYIVALKELKQLLNDKDLYHRCLRIADKEFNIDFSFKQYQEIYDEL
ncbi:MAG: glycosyltransferase [Ignavibacteriaceae bacterium]